MSALSRMLVSVGLLSLFHAAYSAQEVSIIATQLHVKPDLPVDIKAETLVAVFLACLGLVLGSDQLKPIAWNVWAGNIEKEGGAANPFRLFEDRPNYLDIRAKRREFAEWAKNGAIGAS
ncbi:hypothetical protein LTS08_002013 [Lithohypha guttulata]|nr:hypothetical protein LTS08_002013 [Lithohypha guttulata]